MKGSRAKSSHIWINAGIVVGIACLVGIAVPPLSKMPYSLVIVGLGPVLFVFWNPEILVVLLQDALGILRMMTGGIGLTIESGFAMATMGAAAAAYGFMAFRHRLNFGALLSPLAILNYGMAAALAVALVSSGGSEYGIQKLTGFVTFNILSFVLTSLTPPERRRRLLYAFILVGFAALASMVMAGTGPQVASRQAGFGGNPIWTARLLCAAALIILWSPRGSMILRLPLAALFLGASVLTGSRGPLLAVGLVIVVALLGRASMARDREAAGASIVLLAGLVLALGLGLAGLRVVALRQEAADPSSPFVRIFAGTESSQRSAETRVGLYETSLAVFEESPVFGAGLGGLADPLQETSANLYSHNLLLEIAAETGLVGLGIHFVTLILTVLFSFRYLKSPDPRTRGDLEIGLLMLLFSYANAQVSGDLVGNKMVWFFLGFLNGTIPAWHSTRSSSRVAVHRRSSRVRNLPTPGQEGRAHG